MLSIWRRPEYVSRWATRHSFIHSILSYRFYMVFGFIGLRRHARRITHCACVGLCTCALHACALRARVRHQLGSFRTATMADSSEAWHRTFAAGVWTLCLICCVTFCLHLVNCLSFGKRQNMQLQAAERQGRVCVYFWRHYGILFRHFGILNLLGFGTDVFVFLAGSTIFFLYCLGHCF